VDFTAVDRLLDEAVGPVFPAAQLVVVDDFALAHARAVGACSMETVFDLASLTKALSTTTIAMRLLDAVVAALDGPA
jgi:CubicO group peptidase (beta-lactamase class C family)